MPSTETTEKPVWHDVEPTGRLLRPAEVVERVGISRSQVYSLISQERFPPFLKIGHRASGMPEGWLDAYISECAMAAITTNKKEASQ